MAIVADHMALKDVKDHLSEVVDKVERQHDRIVITKHGRPAAVLVSIDDLDSLEETLDILSNPRLVSEIRESLDELERGEAEPMDREAALRLLHK